MYVVRNKRDHKIIYVDQTSATGKIDGKEVYPDFKKRSMEVGWIKGSRIPANFTIADDGEIEEMSRADKIANGIITPGPAHKVKNGKIVPKSAEELLADGTESLEEIKGEMLEYYSQLAFDKRRELIPDYKLRNAALGVYEPDQTASFRETVNAYRTEFYKIRARIDKADSLTKLKRIRENFPQEIVSPSDG